MTYDPDDYDDPEYEPDDEEDTDYEREIRSGESE